MNGETKAILKIAQSSINKAVEETRKKRVEEERKYIAATIGRDLIAILTPLLERIAANSRLTKQEIIEIIGQIKVASPQITVGSPAKVNVPPIIFPKDEMVAAIRKAFAGIQIKAPNVEVKTPDVNIPKQMEVKGIKEHFKSLLNVFSKKLNVGLEEIDRDHPLNVVLVDKDGKYCAMPGTAPCCADCGYILNLKVRSLSSSCPKGKWAAFMSEEMEEELMKKL